VSFEIPQDSLRRGEALDVTRSVAPQLAGKWDHTSGSYGTGRLDKVLNGSETTTRVEEHASGHVSPATSLRGSRALSSSLSVGSIHQLPPSRTSSMVGISLGRPELWQPSSLPKATGDPRVGLRRSDGLTPSEANQHLLRAASEGNTRGMTDFGPTDFRTNTRGPTPNVLLLNRSHPNRCAGSCCWARKIAPDVPYPAHGEGVAESIWVEPEHRRGTEDFRLEAAQETRRQVHDTQLMNSRDFSRFRQTATSGADMRKPVERRAYSLANTLLHVQHGESPPEKFGRRTSFCDVVKQVNFPSKQYDIITGAPVSDLRKWQLHGR